MKDDQATLSVTPRLRACWVVATPFLLVFKSQVGMSQLRASILVSPTMVPTLIENRRARLPNL